MKTIIRKLERVQTEAIKSAVSNLNKGKNALIVLPTGTGKTHTAVKLLKQRLKRNPKARVLWLTHTKELFNQSYNLTKQLVPDAQITKYNWEEKRPDGQIVVGMIPTITRLNHLRKFKPKDFKYIVFDEAHHGPSSSWHRVINHFKGQKIALTATPFRPDDTLEDKKVLNLFGEPAYQMRFSQAQKKKLLAQDESYIILTNSVLKSIVTKDGEYSKKVLDRLYTSKQRNEIIVNSYIKYGRLRMKMLGMQPKAICFCINRDHAKRMAKLFNSRGIKSDIILSANEDQTVTRRRDVWTKFKTTNEIEILCAVNILNEGIDVPDVGCLLMARPTRSNIIYQQQVGRGARAISKQTFIVLDYVDNIRKEWQPYTMGNLPGKRVLRERVVTEYLDVKDPVAIETRVKSVIGGVEEFENTFREYAPDKKKQQLLMLATSNKPRPPSRSLLGMSLQAYLTKTNCAFDPEFSAKIKKIRPDWFRLSITLEMCQQSALGCKTTKEWRKKKGNHYKHALKMGWVKKCLPNVRRRSHVTEASIWNLVEKCSDLTIKEFKKQYPAAQWKARKLGIWSAIKKKLKPRYKFVINLDTGELYSTTGAAGKQFNRDARPISKVVNDDALRAFGYRWAYYDPKKHAHLVKKKGTKKAA
jgi:superfamily II DNA or RNA helicase